ncbi:MAG: TIR domain-containing protein [Deltaproteobacteria bacterium]|nr:TIR domain-containing protein [Deltaproteobacteria bacterium]
MNLSRFISTTDGIIESLTFARDDLRALQTYGRIRYSIDFAYLFSIMFDRHDIKQEPIRQLLADKPSWMHFCISRASFLEFLDALCHSARYAAMLKGGNRDLKMFANSVATAFSLPFESTITSEEMLSQLKKLTDDPAFETGHKAISQFIRLLRDGTLEGLENETGHGIDERFFEEFEKQLEFMIKTRGTRDVRNQRDLKFHYGVDAANLVLTMMAAEGEPLYFLTPLALGRFAAQYQFQHGSKLRTVISALFINKLIDDSKSQNLDEAVLKEQVFQAFQNITSSTKPGIDVTMYHNTFISYGGPDEAFTSKLHDALVTSGVECWFFPVHSIPGKKLHRTMREGVNQHEKVVLVCSEASLNRPGVLNEIEETLQREAREGGKEILIPITLDQHVYTEWAPSYPDIAQAVRDKVIADFKDCHIDAGKFDASLSRLLVGLRK